LSLPTVAGLRALPLALDGARRTAGFFDAAGAGRAGGVTAI
jgi:hypothetical protein